MARPRVQIHCAPTVVLRSLVLVANHHPNRSTQRNSKFGPGLDFHSVLLVSRRSQRTLAWTSSRHLWLDVVLRELHAWRAAIDDTADRAAVGFTIAKRFPMLAFWYWANCLERSEKRGGK